jgi:hypothetical protein
MRTRMLAITIVATAVLAACGRFNDSGDGGDAIAHPTGADELVLRVSNGGGFVPVEYNLRSVPGISIFGDGRMVIEGPQIEIYPGPALPNLQVRQLTEDAIQTILEEARKAGLLGADANYDFPCVADASTTTFTVVADGSTHTVSAYALGPEDAGDCPGIDAEARAELFEFQGKLGGLDGWLPAGSIGTEEPFTGDEMRVYVGDYRGEPDLAQPAVAWPLEAPLQEFGARDATFADYRCGVVAGEDFEALLEQARTANELTPWTSDGERFALILRPLLPDEHTC